MWISAQHNAVIYRVEDPGQIAVAIPGSRIVGDYLAVPNNLPSLQIARLLGLPSPAVMDRYDWPAMPGLTPFVHQKHMANFMALHPKCCNLSDMGTGKTLAVLWASDYLMRLGLIKRVLIIAPLSTLGSVWRDEIFRNFLSRRSSVIVHGDRKTRTVLLAQEHDFYIINHDGLAVGTTRAGRVKIGPVAAHIRDRQDITLVVVDEASAYKDHTTQRYRVLREAVADKSYLWLLSGTPTPNAPTDAWSLGRLVGGTNGESYSSFRSRTMYQVTSFKWIAVKGSQELAHKILRPSIRYRRDECIDLPPVVVETREVQLSENQKKAYDEMRATLALTIGSGAQITAVNEAALRLKLIQIACGAVYGPQHEVNRVDCAPRLNVLHEVIAEAASKVLVFAPLTSVVNLLYAELQAKHGVKAVARIYGATPQGQRSEIFRAFQEESDPKIIVADAGTMSHGLSLQAASTVVWYGATDKPEIYQQANARIVRPGQRHSMLVVHLVGTSIEREIYKRLHEKQSLQGAVLRLVEEER